MKRTLLALVLVLATLSAHAQLLYKISGRELTSPSYIVGTYHLAPVSFVDSIPGIRQAMADTKQTYGELLMEEMFEADSVALMQQAMMLPDGMTLDSLLSADEMQRLNSYMKSLLGMDMTNPMIAQQMNKMTPSAMSTTLTLLNYMKKSGKIDVQNSFDDYFQKEARRQGKGIGGLETLAFQIEVLFKGTPLERQKEQLMCLVDNAAFMDQMTDDIVRAFYAQDLDAIKEAMDRKLNNSCDTQPDEEDKIINDRNANWLKKMPTLMAQMPTLFAVGAAHLTGEKGVLNLLRQAGYTVEGVVGPTSPAHKALVLYYSETGTTKVVAEELQKQTGADIEAIEAVEPYSGNFQETIQRGQREMQSGQTPALRPLKKKIADYDVIFLGYPIWFGTYAMPIATLVKEQDFAGKRIVPFCTFGSGGLNTSSDALRKALPKANIQPGYGVRTARVPAAARELDRFLKENGYKSGTVEPLPDYSAQQPVTDEERAIFDAACSNYQFPLGTPQTVGRRTTPEGTDYKFIVKSRGMNGEEATSTIYVKVGNAADAKPEFTEVIR